MATIEKNFEFSFFNTVRWNSKAARWNFRSLERVRWRHHCWYWWQGTGTAPLKFFTTWTLSLGMLPGFTDLQCKGLCCNVSPSFPLGFKGGRLSFLPLSVVSAVRLFTWWLSVPANSISFFCGCTDLHKLRLSAPPNKLKFAPFFFFLNNWILFLLASCVNSEVVHSSGSLYYDHLKHCSWPGWMIRWI